MTQYRRALAKWLAADAESVRFDHAARRPSTELVCVTIVQRTEYPVMSGSVRPSLSDADVRAIISTFSHWYHRIEIRPGIVTPGVNDSPLHLKVLDLPADLTGARVLDLGARDGFFSFEMERRGADVLAIDYAPIGRTGFPIAAQLLGSRVRYLQENLYNLREADLGTFDLVLFLGLLYHLPDPLGALRIVRRLCRSRMYLETVIIDNCLLMPDGTSVPLEHIDPRLASVPIMRFFPGDACNDDPTNYWGPNIACVKGMLAETEFSVVRVSPLGHRGVFECAVVSDPKTALYLRMASGEESPG